MEGCGNCATIQKGTYLAQHLLSRIFQPIRGLWGSTENNYTQILLSLYLPPHSGLAFVERNSWELPASQDGDVHLYRKPSAQWPQNHPLQRRKSKSKGERQLGVPLRPEVETGNQRQNPAYDCVMCQQPHDTGLSDNIPKETQKSC